MDDFLKHLFKSIMENGDEEEKKFISFGELSESENEEWCTLHSTTDTLNKQYERLMSEKKTVEARFTIFWHKIRYAHRCTDCETVRVHEGKVEGSVP